MPESLLTVVGGLGHYLVVPHSIVHKIHTVHPSDIEGLDRLREILDGWELYGFSPSKADRVEIYGRLDEVWHTAVVAQATVESHFSVLITFHRMYERKVLSRERGGRLIRR